MPLPIRVGTASRRHNAGVACTRTPAAPFERTAPSQGTVQSGARRKRPMYMTDSRSRCTYSRARNGSSTRMIEVVDTREHIRLDDYAGRRRGVRPAPPHGEGERPDGERAPALLHRRRAELAARGVRADGDEAMWKGVPVLGTHEIGRAHV